MSSERWCATPLGTQPTGLLRLWFRLIKFPFLYLIPDVSVGYYIREKRRCSPWKHLSICIFSLQTSTNCALCSIPSASSGPWLASGRSALSEWMLEEVSPTQEHLPVLIDLVIIMYCRNLREENLVAHHINLSRLSQRIRNGKFSKCLHTLHNKQSIEFHLSYSVFLFPK